MWRLTVLPYIVRTCTVLLSSFFQLFLPEDGSRFTVTADGSLVIERVVNDDAGDYVCEVQSPAGSAFAKAKLDVRGQTYLVQIQL